MICAGSSEIAMGQWASAFAESALHVSKTVGDLAGPLGFAVGIMWPGSISISSQILPTGGTAMFALLALAGIGFTIVLVISVYYIRKKV